MGGWFASRHSLGHAIARFARRAGAEYTGRSIGTGLVARSRISVGKAISLAGCAATFFAAGNAIQVSHCAGDKCVTFSDEKITLSSALRSSLVRLRS
jgi:hypothetical protein